MADTTIFGIDLIVLLVFLLVMVGTMLLARAVYSLMRRALDLRIGKRRSKVASNFVQYALLGLGLGYGVLEILDLNLTALAASLGLVGIAVAFSSQQLVQNLIAGVMIAVDHRIQMEDWIEITGEPVDRPARVVDVTLTRTILRDINGRMMVVPNSLLMTNRVVNYTRSGFVEVVVPFPLPLGAERQGAMDTILQVLEEHSSVLPNVKGAELMATERELNVPRLRRFLNDRTKMEQFLPRVWVRELTGLRVNLSVRFWIREVQHRERIISEILSEILDRLGAQGITVP
ncbi:MAG: mechanosensitive ion channel family protein [Methanomassiliicoccales archaeon]|nr:mechanosensitive ion channel family protein [Methanomassiliicoccales archaeon]